MDLFGINNLIEKCEKYARRYGIQGRFAPIDEFRNLIVVLCNDDKIPEDLVEALYQYYGSGRDKVLNDFKRQEFNKLAPIEKARLILKCYTERINPKKLCGISQDEIDSIFEEIGKQKLLLIVELFEQGKTFNRNTITLSIAEQLYLLDTVNQISDPWNKARLIALAEGRQIASYINSNGTNKSIIIKMMADYFYPDYLKAFIPSCESDLDKTILTLSPRITKDNKNQLLSYIDNEYYRTQIVKHIYGKNSSIRYLRILMNEFNKEKTELDRIPQEKDKAAYIAALEDNDVKIQFLRQIKNKENRQMIINSLNCRIDRKIEPYVNFVQTMILEFFQDNLGQKFDDEKRERMQISFFRTDIGFRDLDNAMGKTHTVSHKVLIDNRISKNISKIIQVLLHEYGHCFSMFNRSNTAYIPDSFIEEGTQDLFAELVINHYLEKHKNIEIDGKIVRMPYPYICYSGYDNENAWQRTMLYLSKQNGKMYEALAEYQLGDKAKYLEMTLGKELASKHKKDALGNINISTNWRELYSANPQAWDIVDRKSTLYRRNYMLPLFELQRKLEKRGVDILNGEKQPCQYIANAYFNGRKVYEISREEMDEFCNLFFLQGGVAITDYKAFAIAKIKELNAMDIKNNSFEILNTSLALCKDLRGVGTNMERVWSNALRIEQGKVESQDIDTTLRKYKMIIPEYLEILSRVRNNPSKEYILDAVKDLQFAYLQQIQGWLENGRKNEVLNALRDEKTGEMFLDSSIIEQLESFGISVNYSISDVFQAARNGGIRLDEVGRAKFVFVPEERGNSNEL